MTDAATTLVVFDVAGTTVLDDDLVLDAMQNALRANGADVAREAIKSVMGMPKRVAIEKLLSNGELSIHRAHRVDRIHSEFRHRLCEQYQEHPCVRPADGAPGVFAALKSYGVKVALDTGFDRQILDVLLRRLRWSAPGVIDCSVASDEVLSGRPGPDLIRRAMRLSAVSDPRTVAKVGDTPADLESGHAAGCGLIVGVSYGTHTRAELQRHHPTAIIDDLWSVLPMVIPE